MGLWGRREQRWGVRSEEREVRLQGTVASRGSVEEVWGGGTGAGEGHRRPERSLGRGCRVKDMRSIKIGMMGGRIEGGCGMRGKRREWNRERGLSERDGEGVGGRMGLERREWEGR